MGSTSYTEHTVQLPDGIELCYTDSGAPAASSYCTLVVIHGSGFNGDGFVSLHKYAHQNNLRVVALNRRDYRGSTKYTDAELEDLKAGRKIFLDRLAIQLAWFLQQFVNHEGTPKVSVDRKSGGFVILGWSSGVMTALSLFSDPAAIPQALYETVEPYVKNVVLYDPPYSSLGYPQPDYEGWYNPFTDSDYPTPTQMYENFQQWVSSYFTHPDIESGKPSGISHAKRAEKWTTSSWTGEEKATYFDKIAAVRTEAPAYAPPMRATLKVQTHQALFNGELVSSYFPKVDILHISGTATCSSCMWGYMESLRLYKEAVERGDRVRSTNFRLIQGGNHFLHYDNPEVLLQAVVQGCSDL